MCPYIFIKKSKTGFVITVVFVDYLNLVGTSKELTKTTKYLKRKFEMKDLEKRKYYLVLQI